SQTPRVSLENCFVRGQGDLIAVRAARPLELRVENTLIALTGSFLNVEAGAKEMSAPPVVLVKVSRVTAYLTEYVVRLRTVTPGKEPVVVQVNPAVNCLFASADGKVLIHLDGLEIGKEQMKSLFSWEGGRQNAYSKFQPMLDQQSRGDEMPLPPYDQQYWKTFTGETDALFLLPPVKFPEPPIAPLTRVMPAQFK